MNCALFATYEPVRLWLKERQIKGPFRKLVVSIGDQATTRIPVLVTNSLGVCQVFEGVQLPELREQAGDHRWVLGIVKHALSCVAESRSWRSSELESFIAETSKRPGPQVHFFERLKRVDRRTRTTCVPWLSARSGETMIGVRFVATGDEPRDVTVMSKPGPIFLEYDFPLAKSAIRDSNLVLLDRGGSSLASVPILGGPATLTLVEDGPRWAR